MGGLSVQAYHPSHGYFLIELEHLLEVVGDGGHDQALVGVFDSPDIDSFHG